ncbi:MAG: SMC-Scp complex subunit ScpB [Deltaproteobacteria bacterium]|nr:SMC-Scp complex subunit ScpB [Deltaproteobacteria bacterium]
MEQQELTAIIEALIFVSEEPLTMNGLELVLGTSPATRAAIREAIETLRRQCHERRGGIELREVAGGYQFRTRQSMASWVQRLNVPKPTRLSQAAMETLAIVAYRQPIVRAEVEEIRGVDCGGVLKTLLERNVIKIVGKRDEPGTPLLYGTTREFLSLFNLESLAALPSLQDYRALEAPSSRPTIDPAADAGGVVDTPVEPISVARQIAQASSDQAVMDELEEQIRSLRHLERDIFPRPVETITFVAGEGDAPVADASRSSGDEDVILP